MGQIVYGPGALWLKRLDIPMATPINVGLVNEFSYDEDGEAKALYGTTDYPLAVRRGTVKLTGKAKAALMSAQALNCFNGQTITANSQTFVAQGEAVTVPAAGPYTVTAANGATFSEDLGPVYAATQLPLQNVATVSGAGQYVTAAGGVYTFDSIDSSQAVQLNYSYTSTTAGGYSRTVVAKPIGTMPVFELIYTNTDAVGGSFYVKFYNVISSKLGRGFKLTDFMYPELDFMMGQNAAGQVYFDSYSKSGA